MGHCNGISNTGKCMNRLKKCKQCGAIGCDNYSCTHQLFAFEKCRECGGWEWQDYPGDDPNKSQQCLDIDLYQTIQMKAYFIWEKQGKPQGREADIWLQAEKEVKGIG